MTFYTYITVHGNKFKIPVRKRQGQLSYRKIFELAYQNITATKIAKLDGTTRKAIDHILNRYKLPRVGRGRGKHGTNIKHGINVLAQGCGVSTEAWMRFQIVKKLGNKCISCGERDTRVLEINHLNNSKIRFKRYSLYGRLVRMYQGDTKDLEVRCANCNVRYEYELGRRRLPLNITSTLLRTLRNK